MSDLQKRALLFWLGCIGSRLGLAWLARAYPAALPYMGATALVISAGFLAIYLSGSRKSGAETFGSPIWWNDLRPLHALLYACFAYLALKGQATNASNVLLLDVALAIMAFFTLRKI